MATGLGAGIGVMVGGSRDRGRSTTGAVIVGGLLGGLAATYLQNSSYPDSINLALFALPTIGAMAGYYATRDDAPPVPLLMPERSRQQGTVMMPLGQFSF
ncbi:hypothetical protein BH11MYX2_BH11MYX2_02540 [soil metagenome]